MSSQSPMQALSLVISSLALAASLVTAWLTLLRRGEVKMTHPSVIFFGPDGGRGPEHKPKVYLRTLLFSTSKRGRVIETMHATLYRNESRQTFNIWVIGENNLSRGSGLFVGETGVVANHHFLLPEDGNQFRFQEGTYRIEVFAKLLNEKRQRLLFSHSVVVDANHAQALADSRTGIYFDWGPDSARYFAHAKSSTEIEPHEIQEFFRDIKQMVQPKSDHKKEIQGS